MSQALTSSRLTNSAVNINGATTAIKTNFGLDRIGVTGNSFDISSSSGNVTLGITGTGNVALGNATSGAVSFPGTTTFSTLNSAAAGTDMSVGGNLTTGVLALGSTASTANLYGTLAAKTISGPTAGSAMTIGQNITAGSVTIGNAAANNTVNIGSVGGAGPTGTVNIGTSSSAVNVGTAQPGIVTVGVTGGTAWISGTVNIGATGGGNVAIGPNAGSITNIGNNNAAATTVNVGNTGTSAFGTVNVGRGATAVFIGDNVSSAITLGKTGGSVTLGPPLTLGAAPTTSSMLGFTTNYSITQTLPFTLTNNNYTNLTFNTSGLPLGIYIGTINAALSPTTGTTRINIGVNLVSPTVNINVISSSNISQNASFSGNDYQYVSTICIFAITNATTSTLSPSIYVGGSTAGSTVSSSSLAALRIA